MAFVDMYKTTEQRFWERVDKRGPISKFTPELGNCWLWTGYLMPNGYGQIRTKNGRQYAHRYAYGEIPDGLEIDHLCRTTNCVRKTHLEAITHLENIERGFWHISGNMARLATPRKTHCPSGHPYAGDNLYRGQCRICRAEAMKRLRLKGR